MFQQKHFRLVKEQLLQPPKNVCTEDRVNLIICKIVDYFGRLKIRYIVGVDNYYRNKSLVEREIVIGNHFNEDNQFSKFIYDHFIEATKSHIEHIRRDDDYSKKSHSDRRRSDENYKRGHSPEAFRSSKRKTLSPRVERTRNQFDHRKSPRRDKSTSPWRSHPSSKRSPSLSPVPKNVDLRSKIR